MVAAVVALEEGCCSMMMTAMMMVGMMGLQGSKYATTTRSGKKAQQSLHQK